MTLSPDDIVNYPLKQAVRGYSVKQVDELLDEVADTIEASEQRIADLTERLEAAEEQLAATSETEATLKRTLVTAQRAAEQSLEEAKQRATELVDDARREAAAVVEQAKLEAEELRLESVQAARAEEAETRRRRQAIESHIEAQRTFEPDYRSRLRTLLDEQRRLLDEIPTRPPDLPSGPEAAGGGASERLDTHDPAAERTDRLYGSEREEKASAPSNLTDSTLQQGPQLTVRVRDDAETPRRPEERPSGDDTGEGRDDEEPQSSAPDTDVREPEDPSEDRLWGDAPHHHDDEPREDGPEPD